MAQETLARAKLNLYLDVLGRREDGYHELETLFASLEWGDRVRVAATSEPAVARARDVRIELTITGDPDVPTGDSNLAVKAARLACASKEGHEPLPSRIQIEIEKHIPMGGGLGGGSADAAAVLRLLAPRRAPDLARSLGADVPFAVVGGAAIGRERGDVLETIDVRPSFDVVLIAPPIRCDTATVFRGSGARIRPAPPDGLARAVRALRVNDVAALREAHYNALALSAMRAYPKLRAFMTDVERRLGRPPALSGSGSTLFDLPEPGETEHVLSVLEGLPGTRWVARP